ncbi:La-related protein Larp4B like protein [Argiope bruennichi]|uniref:La-related protein Larp4B like protein n=1 Tax=Argiope bruennichi TaxID=94029 RepID=A0A8T0DZI0_ARGBR|nr:La-related protein Larp4B like protein [Argiope bruennichi]
MDHYQYKAALAQISGKRGNAHASLRSNYRRSGAVHIHSNLTEILPIPKFFSISRVKASNPSEDISETEDSTIACRHDICDIPPQSLEEILPSVSGHVSNIHPGGFCNQTTAQLCKANKSASFLNLETRDLNSKVFPEMEDNTAIPSSPVEAACSTANANPVSPESLNYPINPNPVDIYPANTDHVEDIATGTGDRMPLSTLKALLQRQLEYYFSRENLSTDEYLQSQMDADNYVAISTVANFNQVRRLTDDLNLVVEVLRESAVVQVDEAGEKVRPNPRSGVLILREIPEETPLKEIEELFSGENCPKFLKAEFAHNDSWYVLFESDEDTQKAYQYLREEAKTFRGKPVMARIKAKAITSAPFTTSYKNGFANPQEPENYSGQNVNQQQQPLQYTYSVPNENYNNQQVCSPFYPPTMLQTWAPTTPACVDLGTVLSVNGLTPQQAFRPLPSGNNNRHNYTRDRPVKAYTPQNYNFSRSEQNRYFNRGQSTSYLGRQQIHQQAATFPNIVNASNCAFDYLPYAARSRNLNFGVDMNFFTAPNLYYSKLPSVYPAHASQTRQNPVLMQRNSLGVGAINCQDQSYLAVGNSSSMPYSKDSGMNGASSGKQSADSQVKENWAPNQRQQRGKRHWKENSASGSSRNVRYSDSSNNAYNKSLGETEVKSESPKFDLETTSFPPLPGCLETDIIDVDVYESRLSDIVKGTVKPATRDTKTQTSESGLVCTTKDSSTITIEDAVIPSDGAFTPPDSPDVVAEAGSTADPTANENCQESNEWDDFVESPTENAICSTSITQINTVPEAPSTYNGNSTPVFHLVSTNSMVNGSAAIAESSPPSNLPETDPTANVPSEINDKQTATIKLPKAKQLDSIPKNSRPQCDLPSPKNKTPDVSTKNKFDSFKDRASGATKQNRTSFSSNNKNCESSSSNNNNNNNNNKNEKVNDCLQTIARPTEHSVSRNSEVSHGKDKGAQGHNKNKVLDSNSNKAKTVEPEPTLLTVNGHANATADSESTVSSEDEKPFRRLTYCEVASRGKDKLEKVAQEVKLKDQQEATIRQHHRQQESVAQSRQASTRGTFREIPRGRTVEARPGAREWRERRKPSRAVPLPAAGR